MSTSGVTTYQLTASDLINAAYRKTGVMAKGQTADTEELTYGLQALNLIIPQLRTLGLQLWKLSASTLTLVTNTNTYTLAQPNKPAKIHQAWITPTTSGTKIPVEVVSIFNMNMLPDTSSGTPVKLSYVPGNTSGTITIWPKPSATVVSNYTLYYEEIDEIQIVSSLTETVDFPSEWHQALVWGVASQLAIELNVPLQDRQYIDSQYAKAVELAELGGQENASLFVQPNLER